MYLRRKPKVVLAFVVMLLICGPQSRALLIVTPKYLLLSTGCNVCAATVKLLGIDIEYQLYFDDQVSKQDRLFRIIFLY